MSAQLGLRLVDVPEEAPAPTTQRERGEEALLAPFVSDPRRLLSRAGGLRALIDLRDEDLARHGASRGEIAMLRAALALARHYFETAIARGAPIESPAATRRALTSRLRHLHYEVFVVLYLDTRHRIIQCEEMFRGTVSGASVHPREVVKAALHHNAAAIVCCHNHPSGVAEPSRTDIAITKRLQEALALVDVRLIDHFVIGDGETCSFAERGWL